LVGESARRRRFGATWTLGDGITAGTALEVLDAATGLWLMHPR
jgi:hypothetical protein